MVCCSLTREHPSLGPIQFGPVRCYPRHSRDRQSFGQGTARAFQVWLRLGRVVGSPTLGRLFWSVTVAHKKYPAADALHTGPIRKTIHGKKEERRLGKEGDRTCTYSGTPVH